MMNHQRLHINTTSAVLFKSKHSSWHRDWQIMHSILKFKMKPYKTNNANNNKVLDSRVTSCCTSLSQLLKLSPRPKGIVPASE